MRTAALLFALALLPLAARAEYAEVNGIRMYYEIHGDGRPTVLLHGGGNSVAGTFSKQIPEFAKSRRVIAPEQRGHGHTTDADGPHSYGQMAEDTAALLRRLNIENADVVGWSDGGNIALILAIRHPALVRRVVASGANIDPIGYTAEARDWMATKMDTWTGPSRDYYVKVSPDGPARWPILVAKLKRLWLDTPTSDELSFDLLRKLNRPVLIISGDRDTITHEHTLAMFRALPQGRLFVLPGTGHPTFSARSEWMNPVILSFLDDDIKAPPR